MSYLHRFNTSSLTPRTHSGSIYLSTYLYLYIYLSIYVCIYIYISIYYLSVYYLSIIYYLSIYLSIYGSTALCWALAASSVTWFFTQSIGLLRKGYQPVARPLPAHRTAQTQNKLTQTSMPQVWFEPTIPVFERAKTSSCPRPRGHCGYNRVWQAKWFTSVRLLTSILSFSGILTIIGFLNWPNTSSRTMVLGSTQPLPEMSTTNFLGGKGRPARKADNFTTICESIA
jgi:hypothetical protein